MEEILKSARANLLAGSNKKKLVYHTRTIKSFLKPYIRYRHSLY